VENSLEACPHNFSPSRKSSWVVCPQNDLIAGDKTDHEVFPYKQPERGLRRRPIFNVLEVLRTKTVGILGTRMGMETRLYGSISCAVVVPDEEALDEVHQNYAEMAMVGRVTDAQRRTFFAAGEELYRNRGAEVVLLGGTDLFLAFQGRECGFPVLDCAEVHVEALYKKSVGT
jgi:hypothetical protein